MCNRFKEYTNLLNKDHHKRKVDHLSNSLKVLIDKARILRDLNMYPFFRKLQW